MTNFDYNNGVPSANNNPSNDQPDMLTNTQNLALIWDEDHIGFDSNNGGTHLQTTYTAFSPGTLIAGTQSCTGYPAAGVADVTHSQYYFKNPNGTFILSGLRAFANVTPITTAPPVLATLNNSINVTTVTRVAQGSYDVVLTTNAVTTANFVVLVTGQMNSAFNVGQIVGYNITGIGTFQLNFRQLTSAGGTDPTNFSFAVLQI